MFTVRCTALLFAMVLCASCGLPPSYEPKAGERFWTLLDGEHYSKDNAAGWVPFEMRGDAAGLGILTWRLGKDALLPHAWKVGDNCTITEGTWRDTEFSPPSHGKGTFIGAASGSNEFALARTVCGATGEKDDWKVGSALRAKADGDALPAFDISGTVPAAIKLTTWDLAKAQTDDIKVPRDRALELKWEAGSGEVMVMLSQYTNLPDMDFIHTTWCFFPADAGTGTVPLEVIQSLHKQSDVFESHLYFAGVDHKQSTSGNTDFDWAVWNGSGATIMWEE